MKKLFAAVLAALFALASTAALAQQKKEPDAKKTDAKKEPTKNDRVASAGCVPEKPEAIAIFEPKGFAAP